MKDFTVRQSASDGTFEVIEWTYPTPTSFRGEILYATGCFETANAVCDQFILDADLVYREWLEQQDSELRVLRKTLQSQTLSLPDIL